MRRFVPILSLITVVCSRTSTDTLLSGSFLTAGQSAIELIQPLSTAPTTANPVLVWTSRANVDRYRVEISGSNDFAFLILNKIVDGTNYTLQDTDLNGIAKLDARTYYWRVSIPVASNNLVSATGQLNVLTFSGKTGGENIVYVDGAFDPSLTLVSFGNKSQPFRSIQRAIDAAVTLRNDNNAVQAEVRVAQGTYTDELFMRANVAVYGGYSRTDWSRNITSNVTTINAKFDRTANFPADITQSYKTTTILDGLTLNATILSPAHDNIGVNVAGAGTISNSIINVTTPNVTFKATGILDNGLGLIVNRCTLNVTGNTGAGAAIGIESKSNPDSVFMNNIINATTPGSGSLFGMSISTTGPVISGQVNNNKIIVSANVNGATGIQFASSTTASTIAISNNQVTSTGPGNMWGMNINSLAGSNITVTNNHVYTKSSTNVAYGIYFFASAPGIMTYNTVFAGSDGASVAAAVIMPTGGTVSNNIAFAGGTTTSRNGFGEYGATSYSPNTFTNNLVFDANNALYDDGGTARTSQAAININTNTTGAGGTASGNLAPWGNVYGPNYTSVFRATTSKGVAFSLTDPATWEIKGYINATNGPADVDASGSWSTGDMGANAAALGPQ